MGYLRLFHVQKPYRLNSFFCSLCFHQFFFKTAVQCGNIWEISFFSFNIKNSLHTLQVLQKLSMIQYNCFIISLLLSSFIYCLLVVYKKLTYNLYAPSVAVVQICINIRAFRHVFFPIQGQTPCWDRGYLSKSCICWINVSDTL